MPPPDRSLILHATDFSPASRPALHAAVALASAGRRRLVVIHVAMPPSPFVASALPWTTWEQLERAARREARRRLQRAIGAARRHGVRVTGRILDGPPAATIVRAARALRADAIVLGTHGRTGIGRVAMGSVAAAVLRTAPCPVLTVRGARARR